jgi:hypothetical protein
LGTKLPPFGIIGLLSYIWYATDAIRVSNSFLPEVLDSSQWDSMAWLLIGFRRGSMKAKLYAIIATLGFWQQFFVFLFRLKTGKSWFSKSIPESDKSEREGWRIRTCLSSILIKLTLKQEVEGTATN